MYNNKITVLSIENHFGYYVVSKVKEIECNRFYLTNIVSVCLTLSRVFGYQFVDEGSKICEVLW